MRMWTTEMKKRSMSQLVSTDRLKEGSREQPVLKITNRTGAGAEALSQRGQIMPSTNPFPNDPDRSAIWTMLVPRDIAAFVSADWSMVEGDFVADDFMAINGNRQD